MLENSFLFSTEKVHCLIEYNDIKNVIKFINEVFEAENFSDVFMPRVFVSENKMDMFISAIQLIVA